MWTPADPDLLVRYADACPTPLCGAIVRLLDGGAQAYEMRRQA